MSLPPMGRLTSLKPEIAGRACDQGLIHRMPISILVINPNSSRSVTEGLEVVLKQCTPPDAVLSFYTAPSNAPPSINDVTTGILSAAACFDDLTAKGIDKYDGFLVSCFSDHPLVHMLRESTTKPAIGILEAAIAQSLLCGRRFGIVATGSGYKYHRYAEVRAFMGGDSDRFAGMIPTGLGVIELREGDGQHIESSMKTASKSLAALGSDVMILGCAGMAGMEGMVRDGVSEGGFGPVHVVDGNKAGVEMLVSLVRLQ
ncbi:Asp/Glu/hydantoin racemase [Mycena rebaudengoi]|nr:Asp/Glu/hydantoin racemase [Mycena rebaudengoi]